MPSLPLPVGESSLIRGDVPVSEDADVLAEFPRPQRTPAIAPVRDTFVAGQAAGFLAYQNISARAAMQCDPMRATGEYLKSYAEEHGVAPGVSESEESVRNRLFTAPEIVAPDFIVAGVNALLSSSTSKTCRLSECEVDGMFCHDGTSVWDCYVDVGPDYPDRYYSDIPYLHPGGVIPSSGIPRLFLLRIPSLDDNDLNIAYALTADSDGLFVGDGSDTAGAETDGSDSLTVFSDPQQAADVYLSIVGYVQSVKGQGIPWTLMVDPTL